jgi:hypothetical protein
MQVCLEKDAEGLLGIPYGIRPERRFWNLKSNPEFIDNIPEVADCPDLRKFLLAVADPSIHFYTFGCEKWWKEVDYGNKLTHECGSYIDLGFEFIELAETKDYYLTFVNDVIRHGENLKERDPSSELGLIRFEHKRAGLIEKNVPIWILTAWLYGAGTSLEMAQHFRNYALEQLFICMREKSNEIESIDLESRIRLLD